MNDSKSGGISFKAGWCNTLELGISTFTTLDMSSSCFTGSDVLVIRSLGRSPYRAPATGPQGQSKVIMHISPFRAVGAATAHRSQSKGRGHHDGANRQHPPQGTTPTNRRK